MALSDLLGPALQLGSTILSVGGQLTRAQATRAVGIRRRAAQEFEAGQLEQDAEASRGIGMRTGEQEITRAGLVMSKQLALAAASGAGASDPTVVDLIARTAGEGSYRQSLAMYQGEAQARLDMMRAAAARYEGETAYADSQVAGNAGDMGALSTVLTGGTKIMSMFDKYWAAP